MKGNELKLNWTIMEQRLNWTVYIVLNFENAYICHPPIQNIFLKIKTTLIIQNIRIWFYLLGQKYVYVIITDTCI